MKKINFLFLLTILLTQSCGQTWITTQLDNRVFVDFPIEPEIQELSNKSIYTITNSDYAIFILKTDMSLNSNFDTKQIDLDEFYEGVIDGSLAAASDSQLIHKKTIQIENFEGREIKYTKDFNQMNDILVTKRIVLIDEVFYTFDFWQFSGQKQKELMKKLYKSIVVK